MAPSFPKRPKPHQLETESIAFFMQHIPHEWTCEKQESDYGVDLRIGLATNGQINGQQLVVQIKASEATENREKLAITIDVSTLKLLRNMRSWQRGQVLPFAH
ncbi:MAG: hypothetical protein CVU36_20215 [Betaproteobacteria bacterium HGW-Betaproteobacteria-9]|jgi:hypothetical protein|nr:MAG: hypothetical protein CVU36_20215 [Betaproteobacteria bacterium HGW-Betaproteobacteria-9]